jgi:anti-sigma regulatory factor (Ser/Thr protein kinase)
VARRCGVDEAALDEVRLAVGEACSRAVQLHREYCPDRPVLVTLVDDDTTFRVAVADEAPANGTTTSDDFGDLQELTDDADPDSDTLSPGVGLAVISGLVDDVSIESGNHGGAVVRMTWPRPA